MRLIKQFVYEKGGKYVAAGRVPSLLVAYTTMPDKVFNQCVLPVMTNGTETWTLTIGLIYQFKIAQLAMQRAMLGFFLKDKIINEINRERFKVIDIAHRISKQKWQ